MHVLTDFSGSVFFGAISTGLVVLGLSAARYIRLMNRIRDSDRDLYKQTHRSFSVLILFILFFAIGYAAVIVFFALHIPFDLNALFGPILFFGAFFVLATAYFNIRLFKRIFHSNMELKKQAVHDYMTGLPNRRLIAEKISTAIEEKQRNPKASFAVVMIDILAFKRVNDSFGHYVGDDILVQVSRRLDRNIRKNDWVGRIGGDDFILLLNSVSPREAIKQMNRIREKLLEPYSVDGVRFNLHSGYGICLSGDEDLNPDMLINNANTAMRHSKARGKSKLSVFTNRMQDNARFILQFESDFRRAISNGEFELYFQPQYALRPAPVLTGFEVLVRWNHPEQGMVSPGEFIPVAEETGLILELDRYVLDRACSVWAAWRKKCPACPSLSLSVNLSANHMAEPSLVKLVENTLQRHALPPDCLILELTESAMVTEPEICSLKLEAIRSLGVRVAIDDFGTGYSSLSYLTRFPTYCIKIDRSFINGIESDGSSRQVVRSVVHLVHSLNMVALAEGVELEEQLEVLKELGCDQVQGFYLSRPVKADEALKMMKSFVF